MKKIEAENLICPFIRYGNSKNQSHNIKCITSNCMAWQSTEYKEGHETKEDGTMVRTSFKTNSSTNYGYCMRLSK